jgi:FkbM family methyltransferase
MSFQSLTGKIIGLKRLFNFENKIQLLLSRIFFTSTASVIHKIDGMEILIDYNVGEQNGTGACVANMSYACFIEKMKLGSSLTVVDLGANGGGFPLMLKRMGYTIKKLVAVEMNAKTYGRMAFNLYRNLSCDIVALNGAVADQEGFIDLPSCDGGIGDSIYNQEANSQSEDSRRVKLLAFDQVIDVHFPHDLIDIVKIDIEGAEFPILGSLGFEAIKKAKNVIIEVHDHSEWSWDRVHQTFKEKGFDLMDSRSSYEENVFAYVRS